MNADSIDETIRRRFELSWTRGSPDSIDDLLPPEEDPRYLATLEELIHIELEFAWKQTPERTAAGDFSQTTAGLPLVETYLKRFPKLDEREIVLRLLQQEYLVRRQSGAEASIEEYHDRFPELAAGTELDSALRAASGGDTRLGPGGTLHSGSPVRPSDEETLPRQFGSYELLEEIGRGGMGVVYRARQSEADRIVALKVIRRDRLESLPRDSQASTMDRFRHEAQAAARLEHENIVTVYEVGEVEGQQFFSMRYVQGRSLAEILHDRPIEDRTAAGYIEPVARAVQEAHSHGILHRDLKPQNILVDGHTDQALVADFGLAKLLESGDELTQSGEIMGSPPYMSPEQALDSSRVTCQSDVYALGATLYHIITGRPPFQAATSLETLRQVIDQEPVPPRRLNSSIDRDVETICLKCLEKEASRRYASAEALADDLARYLKGEPILARPVGPSERAFRWCRRNPMMASLIGSTVVFLVLAVAVTFIAYVKTSAALEDSEVSFGQARKAVDDLFTEVSEDTLLNKPGMQPLRKRLLQRALDYYQRFVKQRGDDPAIQDELARTHFRIGRIKEEIDSPQTAYSSYDRAIQMQRRLLAQRPGDSDTLEDLGNSLSSLGNVLLRQAKLDEALKAHQEAADIRQQLLRMAPQNRLFKRLLASSRMNIGVVQRESRRLDEARREFEEAQALRSEILKYGPDYPEARRDLAMGYYNLALLALSLQPKDFEAARSSFEDAIGVFKRLLDDDPEDLANQYRLFLCYRLLADLESRMENWDTALKLYQNALVQMEELATLNPSVAEYQADLACIQMNLGLFYADQSQSDKAEEALLRSVDLLEKLLADYPHVPRYKRDLAVALLDLAGVMQDRGDFEAARGNLETCQNLLDELAEQFPDDAEYPKLLAEANAALDAAESRPIEQE